MPLTEGAAGTTRYTSGAVGTWFLPALNELGDFDGGLYKIYAAYGATDFNNIITTAGGRSLIDGTGYYWTSVENSNTFAKMVYFGSSYNSSVTKDNTGGSCARAICLF